MALVEKPRNNLQHHLAWFVSQKPQIPPRGQIIPVKADVRPVLPTVTASQQEAATSTTSVCVTASVMLTQAIHPPSRSDLKPKQLEVENDPFNTAHALQIGPGKSLLTKLRNDQVGRLIDCFNSNPSRCAYPSFFLYYKTPVNPRNHRSGL